MSPKVKALLTMKGMAILLAIWWVYSAPTSAAHIANKGIGGLKHAGHSAQAFLSNIG
jgi:hypothetical protein